MVAIPEHVPRGTVVQGEIPGEDIPTQGFQDAAFLGIKSLVS